ncbi:monovalent cation/H+ antiporter complex subunit F [Enemella sp. A6]|uniref:monovalent cation/H+ antiporter complex subunit F n=1 Tax=Enemella sp. A6 TaxID=3440152 RepID=UPI003EBE564F
MSAIQIATVVFIVLAGLVLLTAALLTLIRLSRGPSNLDRIIASDVMVGVVIAGLAIEAAVHKHSTTYPVMVVLSLVGFAGAVGMARFVGDRDRDPATRHPSPKIEERGEQG